MIIAETYLSETLGFKEKEKKSVGPSDKNLK